MNIDTQDFKSEIKLHGDEYQKAFKRVLNSGWFILGKEVESFEKSFADYLGVKHCVGVANGLEAIQIALMALEIGKGDEVITTPLSAVATTLAILAVGAKPVFADVDQAGLIDLTKLEATLTTHTKAILPVHLYGQPLAMNELISFCKKHKLLLIEDAAQAQGSEYNGKKIGSFGIISAFSFYPTKNLGAFGDSGAVVTNDSHLAEMMRQLRDYGQSKKYHHVRFGLNSRLDEVHAAILSAKLKHLDQDNKKRQRVAKWYLKELSLIKQIKVVTLNEYGIGNYHQFVISTDQRDALQAYLKQKKIATMIHYPLCIPDQPIFENKYLKLKIPQTRALTDSILSLPMYSSLTKTQVEYVCHQIASFFQEK